MYAYKQTQQPSKDNDYNALYTVGLVDSEGHMVETESDHQFADQAAARVAYLNGGQRLPEREPDPAAYEPPQILELLDHFAVAALTGYLPDCNLPADADDRTQHAERLAKTVWDIAEAMVIERERRGIKPTIERENLGTGGVYKITHPSRAVCLVTAQTQLAELDSHRDPVLTGPRRHGDGWLAEVKYYGLD